MDDAWLFSGQVPRGNDTGFFISSCTPPWRTRRLPRARVPPLPHAVVEGDMVTPAEEVQPEAELPQGEDMEVKAIEPETASAAAEGEGEPHLPNTWGPCPQGHVSLVSTS